MEKKENGFLSYVWVICRNSLWLLADEVTHPLAGKPWKATFEDPLNDIGIKLINLPFFLNRELYYFSDFLIITIYAH